MLLAKECGDGNEDHTAVPGIRDLGEKQLFDFMLLAPRQQGAALL